MSHARRVAALLTAAFLAAPPPSMTSGVAAQGARPPMAVGTPPEARPFSPGPVRATSACRTTAAIGLAERATGRQLRDVDTDALWRISRGAGQVVAVIDTGVNPGPRLPRLRGAGDYVGDSAGLDDCDAHGTLVAGIIAASDVGDGFSGLAPDAEIVSVRHSSSIYQLAEQPTEQPAEAASAGRGIGSLSTLARAIRAAADAGATVISISEVACVSAGTPLADGPLGAALRYAVIDKDVVVVAAAGNVGVDCPGQNPGGVRDPSRAWPEVEVVASPAWYTGLVLTVGAVDSSGGPAEYSLHGPWVDVAAPGTGIVTLSADASGPANFVVQPDDSLTPVEGTSFAAPLVAATAALVRDAHPRLDAREVMDRIRRTAVGSPNGSDQALGYGIVDPLAALTAVAPAAGGGPSSQGVEVPTPPVPAPRGEAGLLVAGVAAVTLLLSAVGLGVRRWLRV